MDNGRKEYTFSWFIENYSYCWHKNAEELVSPKFTVNELEGTTWELELYPRGVNYVHSDHMSLYLMRSVQDDGPQTISLNCQLSIIAVDGSATSYNGFHRFENEGARGSERFLKTDEILLRRKSHYLPQDILTVRCKIWKGAGEVHYTGQSSARSHIRIEKNSFLYVVEKFSTLQADLNQTIKIRSHSKKESFISSSLYFTEGLCCEEKMMVEIELSDDDRILWRCVISLLDGSGDAIECGETDNRYDAARKKIHTLPLSLTRDEILNRKREYLPDDKLSLIYECTFSSELKLQTIEKTLNEVPSAVMKRKRNYVRRKNDYIASKKCTNPSVSEDMKSLYISQYLTDVEVKTDTKSFSAHKIVLCARSPVFKAMMTKDMQEKNTNCIRVDDLEADVVQQLLIFMYSDNIENPQWENATRLYYAADKYQIGKLKEVCSCFFVENLTTTKAIELLLLADDHSDGDLKNSVEDFILEHEEEIFVSKEWEMLMETNPLLVMKTVQLKYKRKDELNLS